MGRKREDGVWGMLTGAFRLGGKGHPEAGASQTELMGSDEILLGEVRRQIERAGLPAGMFETRVMPARRGLSRDGVTASEDWVVYIRVHRWADETGLFIAFLERQLRLEFRGSGLAVTAVYWRVQPDALKAYRDQSPSAVGPALD